MRSRDPRHRDCGAVPRRGGRWRWQPRVGRVIAVAALALSAVRWIARSARRRCGEGLDFSTVVVDREGRLLRPYATQEGRWRLPATSRDVDPRFLAHADRL